MNIYDMRRYGRVAFFVIAIGVVAVFLRISSDLVADLAEQERERMQIWADATKRIADISMDQSDMNSSDDIEFLLDIIRRNNTIPVLLTDAESNILDHRNFSLPEPLDSLEPFVLSASNREYLEGRLQRLRTSQNVIDIAITDDPADLQHLYYEDSSLLRRLSFYPYLQLLVMLAFIVVVYFAVLSTKKAEQNKVWVGLSKETAHQLGTPISSLMAWTELLRADPSVDPSVVAEMDKDVNRLSTIASRFSKIGSRPTLETADLRDIVTHATDYMRSRISSRISLTADICASPLPVSLSAPLVEWVLENLIKNAVDAMEGAGSIHVETHADGTNTAVIDVTDTGKGIPRKRQKTIFNPGYTTKKRGWGLGLTLARRIVEQYHGGTIRVLRSEPHIGTTFRLTLPIARG